MILSYCSSCRMLIRNPIQRDPLDTGAHHIKCPTCMKYERDKDRIETSRRRPRTSRIQSSSTHNTHSSWKKYIYSLAALSVLFACFSGYRLVNAQSLSAARLPQSESRMPIPVKGEESLATSQLETVLSTTVEKRIDTESHPPAATEHVSVPNVQFQSWRECFSLDKNKDKRISLEEFNHSEFGMTEASRAYFKRLDSNNDGFINRDEFRRFKSLE